MRRACGLAFGLLLIVTGGAAAAQPAVVASIPPIHALVAGVMAGVGTPHLVVRGGQSPHSYSLRPSDARAIETADVVVWVGPDLEAFLAGPLDSLATNARVVALAEVDGLTRLPTRGGGVFDHADHAAADADHDHGHDHGRDHDHGAMDMHLWLDPVNARAMVGAIAAGLAAADPDHAAAYRANADALRARIDALIAEVEALLAPVASAPFLVFHDAYQYFEHRFGVDAVGTITVSPAAIPGAARIAEIRTAVRDSGAVCVFAEPQFEPRLVRVVTEGTAARTGTLDPLGADLEPGPGLYEALIRGLAESMRSCLAGE
ncbi:zinc ABC transporter substrate-binding protein [Roseospira goensis]|uniref:High-affinity zinc uptake system protein ZnuA n=1 Tax=Roseospira goensis TaxID=391922 RepID=A0A7W6WJJ2_9PROT|nr:zinc ABC transporter substrate-binding protein [Roseospira goensis]MBB4285316.1 zinc transport system substrate-binding protein [Roseospira goensis]